MLGFGSLFAFKVAGGEVPPITVLNNLQLIEILINLCESKSLAHHPFTTTHYNVSPKDLASLGISSGHICFSVGWGMWTT